MTGNKGQSGLFDVDDGNLVFLNWRGVPISLEDPRPGVQELWLEDIALPLSGLARYTANTWDILDAAVHSVNVSRACPQYAWRALMHEDHEAIFGDMPTPWKNLIRKKTGDANFIRALLAPLRIALAERFEYDLVEPYEVKVADRSVFAAELRDLGAPNRLEFSDISDVSAERIVPLSRWESFSLFMERAYELGKRHLSRPEILYPRHNGASPGRPPSSDISAIGMALDGPAAPGTVVDTPCGRVLILANAGYQRQRAAPRNQGSRS